MRKCAVEGFIILDPVYWIIAIIKAFENLVVLMYPIFQLYMQKIILLIRHCTIIACNDKVLIVVFTENFLNRFFIKTTHRITSKALQLNLAYLVTFNIN